MDTEEGLLLKVDLFLSELERRLDFIERYHDLGEYSFSRAFSTLQTVRTRCAHASEEVIGAGRRRLHFGSSALVCALSALVCACLRSSAPLSAREKLQAKKAVCSLPQPR